MHHPQRLGLSLRTAFSDRHVADLEPWEPVTAAGWRGASQSNCALEGYQGEQPSDTHFSQDHCRLISYIPLPAMVEQTERVLIEQKQKRNVD